MPQITLAILKPAILQLLVIRWSRKYLKMFSGNKLPPHTSHVLKTLDINTAENKMGSEVGSVVKKIYQSEATKKRIFKNDSGKRKIVSHSWNVIPDFVLQKWKKDFIGIFKEATLHPPVMLHYTLFWNVNTGCSWSAWHIICKNFDNWKIIKWRSRSNFWQK